MQKARIKLASADIDKVNNVCEFIKDISTKSAVLSIDRRASTLLQDFINT